MLVLLFWREYLCGLPLEERTKFKNAPPKKDGIAATIRNRLNSIVAQDENEKTLSVKQVISEDRLLDDPRFPSRPKHSVELFFEFEIGRNGLAAR